MFHLDSSANGCDPVENLISIKFIGLAKSVVGLFDKSGLRRVSSWILVCLTALPISMGSVIAGSLATYGLNISISWMVILLFIVEVVAVILFYFVRTVSNIWALKHLLKDLGVVLTGDQLTTILDPAFVEPNESPPRDYPSDLPSTIDSPADLAQVQATLAHMMQLLKQYQDTHGGDITT